MIPALFLTHLAFGQQLRFGVKGGLNYAKPRIRNVVGPDRLLGINGGVVLRYSFATDGFWNVQPELLFSAKGAKDKYGRTVTGERATYNYRQNYLELPILAKINTHGLTFEAGPQLGYLLSFSDNNDNPLYQRPQRQDYNSVQLGYIVGVGYELPTGLSLTLRYSDDITGIYAASAAPRNSVLQAQLGYLFGMK
ncbi:PorT family protein [Hymenobacter qilianensis]|uniref:PorT family protein n=1 Tax=Hymenobacter qilianensis TaxID=1385715 RepID=A0A7H0GVR4_9BACT|nr:porin family protein [Hymenobacter qilianensis]QNP52380.1 PorT family protein [Hymenobacter qilianensis]